MEYIENNLTYEDYCELRQSVGWKNFSQTQTQNALEHSIYTITAIENNQTIAMGRLIGDGLYYLIADVIVCPDFQNQKIGTSILNLLLKYVDAHTPAGGRSSIQLIAEKGKEPFYESLGFKKYHMNFVAAVCEKLSIRKPQINIKR